jgi:hypothetical protein
LLVVRSPLKVLAWLRSFASGEVNGARPSGYQRERSTSISPRVPFTSMRKTACGVSTARSTSNHSPPWPISKL